MELVFNEHNEVLEILLNLMKTAVIIKPKV